MGHRSESKRVYGWSESKLVLVNVSCIYKFFLLFPATMGKFYRHHVRFYDFVPNGVKTLAYNESQKKMAVSR